MSFSRDWNGSDPIDHTLNRNWPTECRDIKDDVADRLTDMINGFSSGEADVGIKKLAFIAQGSAPSTVTDQIQLYGKVVSTKTELHFKDEDGNERQLSSGGVLNAAILGGILSSTIFAQIYPIGCIYTTIVSTNPNTVFGFGTWVAFGAGRVMVGLDSGQTEFDVVEETGGSKTHTLLESEMPAHTHSAPVAFTGFGGTDGLGSTSAGSTGSTGGGGAHNNLQPYIVVYFFKRTA